MVFDFFKRRSDVAPEGPRRCATLHWEVQTAGWVFRVLESSAPVTLEQWPTLEVRGRGDRRVSLSPLLRLHQEEQSVWTGEGSMWVTHICLARLTERERRELDLPPSPTEILRVAHHRSFSDRDFRLEYSFESASGLPLTPRERIGCRALLGSKEIVLPSPMYELLTEIDALNAAPPPSQEERMTAWSQLSRHLPEGAVLDPFLRELRIFHASSVGIEPRMNSEGEPDFEPVVLSRKRVEGSGFEEGENLTGFRTERLGGLAGEKFSQVFRKREGAVANYALGDNVYVFSDPSLQPVLKVLKHLQNSPAAERRRFLLHPRAVLRQKLEDSGEFDEAAFDILLDDDGLGERVRGVGLWDPVVLPWLPQLGGSWLPPDRVRLVIDGKPIELSRERLPVVTERVVEALARGQSRVAVDGVELPVSEQCVDALKRLEEMFPPVGPTEEEAVVPEAKPPVVPIVLKIEDNLEHHSHTATTRPSTLPEDGLPSNLKSRLLPHQVDAIRWLQERWRTGARGALLADDMGLGKTLSALVFLRWLQEVIVAGDWPSRPLLIVAPTGLIQNWNDESQLHFEGGIGAPIIAQGAGLKQLRTSPTAARELGTGLPELDIQRLKAATWVLTSYETLRDFQHSFGRVHWALLILDEAQRVKNPGSGVTAAAKAMNSDFFLALTGTPVENRLADLWCLVDTVSAGYLGSHKEFTRTYETISPKDREDGRLLELRSRILEKPAPPLMLRRMKLDHLEGLPTKTERLLKVEMRPRQAAEYEKIVTRGRQARGRGSMLKVIQDLRRISLHGGSLAEARDDQDFIEGSARLEASMALLEQIRAAGERALVFVDSLEMQDALVEIFSRRFRLRRRLLVINGSLDGSGRKKLVDEFQARDGFDVMILSPRAGGVGLTLTTANHVIHLDRWWNPAVEDQCTDRVYRIGQSRAVTVHIPQAIHPSYREHSFDLRLHALLEKKRHLSRSVLLPPLESDEDLEELFEQTVSMGEIGSSR